MVSVVPPSVTVSAPPMEHHDEGRRRQQCRGDAGEEIDRRIGRDAQIFRDPVFGISVIAADEVELVVTPVGKPPRQHAGREPGPPAPLDAHPREHLRNAEHDAADRKRKKHCGEMEDRCRIAPFDRVEDRSVPDIDAVLESDGEDDQHAEADRERPGEAIAAMSPEAARADPEPRQQIILAGLLGLLG